MKALRSILICLLIVSLAAVGLVACGPDKDLVAAKDYVRNLYINKAETTAKAYEVVSVVKVNNVDYNVAWSVNVAEESVKVGEPADGIVTISVNERAAEDISYTLTATVSNADGKSVTTEFPRTVPAYKVATWAEYMSAENDEPIVVQGIVTGIISKAKGNTSDSLYFQDANGGYYAYGIEGGIEGIVEGSEILVFGQKGEYGGAHQIGKGCSVELLDSAVSVQTAKDVTDIYEAAEDTKADALANLQNQLVTIKGVEVTAKGDDASYYNFKLDDLASYVRISSSSCPASKDDQKTLSDTYGKKLGWTADVTGIVTLYSGAFYITPIDTAFEYVSLPAKDDAGQVAFEKDNLTLVEEVEEDTVINLLVKGAGYTDVAISWESDNAVAVVDDGKLTITLPDEDVTVKLTATLTKGDETDTKEFSIKVPAATTQEYLPVAVEEAKEGTYKLTTFQAKLDKQLYFTGEIVNNYYYGTSSKAADAVDVEVKAVKEGEVIKGYTLKAGDKFLEITARLDGGKVKGTPVLVDEYKGLWQWNDNVKTFTFEAAADADNKDVFYLGTYSNFNTFGASNLFYITEDDGTAKDNIGVSNFVAQLCTLVIADYKPTTVEEAKEGTYQLTTFQAKLDKQLYFTGEIVNNYYYGTSNKAADAVDVEVKAVKEGEVIKGYTLKAGDKFLEITARLDGGKIKGTPVLVDECKGLWQWNDNVKTFTFEAAADADNKDVFYLGTYSNYNTFGASNLFYITEDDGTAKDNIGVSNFVAQLCTIELVEQEDIVATEVAEGTYKLAMDHTKHGMLYASGEMDRFYLGTTDKAAKAADLEVIAVEGGFNLKLGDKFLGYAISTSGDKTYHNVKLFDEVTNNDGASSVWSWDATNKCFTIKIGENTRWLGTTGDFKTFSLNEIDDVAEAKGKATLYIRQFVEEAPAA